MDNIRKYLSENRSSFDTDIPDEENWARMSRKFSEMGRTRRVRVRKLISLGIAASVLLAAAGLILWKMNGASNRRMPMQGTSITAAPAIPQAQAVARLYSPVVRRELKDLGKTSFYGPSRSDFKVFSFQWKALEANEKAIEQNMRSVGPNSRSIQQLTDNYELKIRLLRQFSVEINKVKDLLPPADTLVKVPSLSILSIKTSNYEKE